MSFTIYPLKEGTKFNGKIYFTNLDEEDIGLLAWALRLNDDCFQNIGLAKPYGFGRVKVEDIELKIENLDTKYNSFSFDYFETQDVNKFIDIYKKNFASSYLSGGSLEEQKPVKELMKIKSKLVEESEANNYNYMKLNEFKDKRVLLEILDYERLISTTYANNNRQSNNAFSKKNYNNNKAKQNTYKADQKQGSFNNNAIMEAFKAAENKKNNTKKK